MSMKNSNIYKETKMGNQLNDKHAVKNIVKF